jgi:hypothetical protein
MSPTDIFEVYLEYYKKYENNLMSDEYDVESFTINDIVHSRATQTNYKIIDVINTDNKDVNQIVEEMKRIIDSE